MANRTLTQFVTGPVPILGFAILLLTTLVLMSDATQNSTRFGELYSLLLVVNALGLIALGALIGWNLVRLLKQVRDQHAGAALTVRLVTMFVVLAVTPLLIVYAFSWQFLNRGIDSWFDVRIESALDDALKLSQAALDVRMRELLRETESIASQLSAFSDDAASIALEDARQNSSAVELSLIAPNGRILAASSDDPTSIVPDQPADGILLQLRQTQSYIGLDPIGDKGLHIRIAVTVPEIVSGAKRRILQALYPVAERMNTLADSVESAYAKYRELAYLRKPLKISFTLTLTLVLLLSLLTAVWAAFVSARRMVAPLRDLAYGTQAVAHGDLETRLPQSSADEVGFLVDSFNDMTKTLALARDETRRSQQELESQRTYLQAVLARLSSGVITLDDEHRVITSNKAAQQILGVELEQILDQPLEAAAQINPHLASLSDALVPHFSEGDDDWREQVVLFGAEGRQVLMCRGATLPVSEHVAAGHVVVFDDVTALIQAQRNAAWTEAARRLAHEIKNPLTPIQLSAERLRHKYLDKMSSQDAEILDRLTRTIVQQVEGMKEMVNAFSDYARTPQVRPQWLNLNTLVADVVELYRSDVSAGTIKTRLSRELPAIYADPDRIGQVLHNLIKNALEASTTGQGAGVAVETRCVKDSARSYISLTISDSGGGFADGIIEQVFEPYVTTKPRGTGLGLAIVRKIVEEHGGVVYARNNRRGGATVSVRLPAKSGAEERSGNMTREAV